ncbi:peptidylprolyl isomerase [Pelagibacterium sp.]|uniref:peptidylprolyl isomerase n=1 Tax=Pelagibacterium sp. TaxID=1967288 RepID=UPI003A900236
MTVPVLIETELGSFTVDVDESSAPLTARNFLDYVDGRHLDGASAYRIVTLANQPAETVHKIEVVQWGIQSSEEQPAPFPNIAHETTEQTGLRHKHMTISMARLAPGSAGSEFFICIGDQPELDFGGQRNPDGQGFAAFGTVVQGQDTVLSIFARAEASEYPATPIKFSRCTRVQPA